MSFEISCSQLIAHCSKLFPKETPTVVKKQPTKTPPHPNVLLIDLAAIDPHPENARKDFDQAELQQLAHSMDAHGLVQPIVVREWGKKGRYQLVAGERRYRAAKLAKWKAIPASVRKIGDEEAVALMLAENLERKDLNAIERAAGLKQLTIGDAGLTHKEAAERFGRSVAWVSNSMRLLELPGPWKKRVVSGEIPETFARLLLPYKDCGPLVDVLDKEVLAKAGEMSRDEFEDRIAWRTDENSRVMKTKGALHEKYWLRKFDVDDATREKLGVIEVPGRKGEMEERATNVKLWDKLQAAAEKAGEKKKAAGGKTAAKKKKLTPAQAQAKADEQARQLAERIRRWKLMFLRSAAAERIAGGSNRGYGTAVEPATLLLVMDVGIGGGGLRYRDHLDEAMREVGVRGGRYAGVSTKLLTLVASRIQSVAVDVCVRMLEDESIEWRGDLVERLAEILSLSVDDLWHEARKSPEGRRRLGTFFELHTKDALVDLVAEWKVGTRLAVQSAKSKADYVRGLLALMPGMMLAAPKSLKERKKRKKK